ncbi:adenine phosphoribosyltransferase 1-like isoform X1 [Wolffia australiana]
MASQAQAEDSRLERIAKAIRVIPNFPKPGIMFQDITTLLLDPKAFRDTVDLFVERYKDMNISVVAGVEARGFIFGPPIALALGAKFVPLRKPKKLPGEVISEEYTLEYGTDRIEMHVGAVQTGERAIIVDDLVATGGTLSAAIKLLERVGVDVVECACVIELPELKGRERLGERSLFILVKAF